MTSSSLLNKAPRATALRRDAGLHRRARLQFTMTALVAVGACFFVTTHARAQTPSQSEEVVAPEALKQGGKSSWALGVGLGVRERAYADADRKFNALPLLFYENDWLRVAGPTVEAKLLNHAFSPTQRVTGGLQIKYAPEGYEASDSPRLTGMAERKGGFLGGVGLTWHNPVAEVSLDWSHDISGYSKGQRLELQAQRRFQFGMAGLTPRLGAQWMDRKWVDYYYGVRAQEALADRAAYNGEAGMALEAGVRLDYSFMQRHTVFLDLGVTHLPKEVTNSSIVDRSNVPRAAVGYLYRF